jgi:hypothetical protein
VGKQALATAALEQSADTMREGAASVLSGPGTAAERIERYLRLERDGLRGCRVGRMTFDPDVVTTPGLLEPVATTLDWLVGTLADVIREGVRDGEFAPDLDARALASALAAVVQGGYVLARAQQSVQPFDAAIDGAVALLAGLARAAGSAGSAGSAGQSGSAEPGSERNPA